MTGGGGRHIYLLDPGGELRGELASGVELKRHGYVVVPPSRTTGPNVWACDREPGAVELAVVPERWLAAMCAPGRRAATAHEHDDDVLRSIPAAEYVERLTGRTPDRRAFVRCPFHAGGDERTRSSVITTSCSSRSAPSGRRNSS